MYHINNAFKAQLRHISKKETKTKNTKKKNKQPNKNRPILLASTTNTPL